MESEVENNHLLDGALSFAKNSGRRIPGYGFYLATDDGVGVCAAMKVSSQRILVSAASPKAARFLGRELIRRSVTVDRALGPAETVAALTEFTSIEAQCRILQLKIAGRPDAIHAPTPTLGEWRPARLRDAEQCLTWSRRLAYESGIHEANEESEELIRRYIRNKQLFVWENRKAVAMAGYSGLTPNGARINMVYTDPAARSRGYGGALVAALTRSLLSEPSRRFCCLLVNAKNSGAHRLYERIGFQRVSELVALTGSKVKTTGK